MSYTHITSDERDMLQVLRDRDLDMDIVARMLCRHPSSLYREIDRNSSHGLYISGKADNRACKRRESNRPSPVLENKPLIKCVEKLLREDCSPDEIVGRIKLEQQHPDWHICYETIYKHIYSEARKGNDLRSHLRQGRKTRRKRSLKKDRRGIIPDRVFIDSRPSIVELKSRRGDWEGDTIEGARKEGYVATWVDRSKKYLVAYTSFLIRLLKLLLMVQKRHSGKYPRSIGKHLRLIMARNSPCIKISLNGLVVRSTLLTLTILGNEV